MSSLVIYYAARKSCPNRPSRILKKGGMYVSMRFLRSRLVLVLILAIAVSNIASPVARAADGDLDPMFGTNGKVITDFGHNEDVSTVLVQEDGKIVAVGSAISGDGFEIARYDTSGNLDLNFGM